jgi:MoxR-like ATPase
MQRFEGTSSYVATDDLKVAVNAAMILRRPLLVKGEPGTGKTVLAQEIARAVSAPLIEWNVKSTTKAHQGLYEYDAVARLRDGQLGDERVHDIRNYIKRGKLWEAFTSPALPVLLIDEIDKADIEFPNDLLQELDRMSFDVYETGERIAAAERPIVVITSNNEKELPDAFRAAASSTTSSSPIARRCRRSSTFTFRESRRRSFPRRWRSSTRSAKCPASRRSHRRASCSTGSSCC